MNEAILVALKMRNLALALALGQTKPKAAAEALQRLADDLDPSAPIFGGDDGDGASRAIPEEPTQEDFLGQALQP